METVSFEETLISFNQVLSTTAQIAAMVMCNLWVRFVILLFTLLGSQ